MAADFEQDATATAINLRDPANRVLAVRIGTSWVEIRRNASMSAVREYLFGRGDDALDQGQMDTLDLLAQRQHWRMSELAEALRVDPSTGTRAVQRLEAVGLATRSPDPDDGRVVMAAITTAGRARHAEVNLRRGQVLGYVLSQYTPEERPVLAEMLERFTSAVDKFVTDL
jgi:DNA-binding MarR family transcriptional regulator